LDAKTAPQRDNIAGDLTNGQGWAFAGKLAEPSAAPLGFAWAGAETVVPLTGFYLFTAFGARQESTGEQAMKRTA